MKSGKLNAQTAPAGQPVTGASGDSAGVPPPGFPFLPPGMDAQGLKAMEDLFSSEEFKKANEKFMDLLGGAGAPNPFEGGGAEAGGMPSPEMMQALLGGMGGMGGGLGGPGAPPFMPGMMPPMAGAGGPGGDENPFMQSYQDMQK